MSAKTNRGKNNPTSPASVANIANSSNNGQTVTSVEQTNNNTEKEITMSTINETATIINDFEKAHENAKVADYIDLWDNHQENIEILDYSLNGIYNKISPFLVEEKQPFNKMYSLSETLTRQYIIGIIADLIKYRQTSHPIENMAISPNPIIWDVIFKTYSNSSMIHTSATNRENPEQSFRNQIVLIPSKVKQIMIVLQPRMNNLWEMKVPSTKITIDEMKQHLLDDGMATKKFLEKATDATIKKMWKDMKGSPAPDNPETVDESDE